MKSGLVQAGLVVSGEGSDPCKCKLPYTTLTLHQLWTAVVIIIIIAIIIAIIIVFIIVIIIDIIIVSQLSIVVIIARFAQYYSLTIVIMITILPFALFSVAFITDSLF